MSACDSPWHIGAYPVLLRLLAPRHPPCALHSLTCWFAKQITLEYLLRKTPPATKVLVMFDEVKLKDEHVVFITPPKDLFFLWEILRVDECKHSSRGFTSWNAHDAWYTLARSNHLLLSPCGDDEIVEYSLWHPPSLCRIWIECIAFNNGCAIEILLKAFWHRQKD